jgi:hypothetical protein
VTIQSGREVRRYTLNQKLPPKEGLFQTIATLMLGGETKVTLSNQGTDGHVIIDAVRFIKE